MTRGVPLLLPFFLIVLVVVAIVTQYNVIGFANVVSLPAQSFSRDARSVSRTPQTPCQQQFYNKLNSLNKTENDMLVYECFNYHDTHLTVLGMSLSEINSQLLNFSLNGVSLSNYKLTYAHRTFSIDFPLTRATRGYREQLLTYKIDGCEFTKHCDMYQDRRKDELNMCVYTHRNLTTIRPFLDFYNSFADRIFIYNNNDLNTEEYKGLEVGNEEKYKVIPWRAEDLRDPHVASTVYDELVAHNFRNYSRDVQKVQTNDCMFKNRQTDMVLLIDDDEYLNYHDRSFYRDIYHEIKDTHDDIVLYRNYCNSTAITTTNKISDVLSQSTAKCAEARGIRLEKAFVLPRNCDLYEIHRCTSANSYDFRHLNIFLAHKPYKKDEGTGRNENMTKSQKAARMAKRRASRALKERKHARKQSVKRKSVLV